MSRLITVFGATGMQGSAVINSILADPVLSKEFRIRGITRDLSKPAAQSLIEKDIEVQVADLNSPASVTRAVEGSHTVFLVTTPDFSSGTSEEFSHGKNVADAAERAGIQHLIYSSLLHVSDMTHGRLSHVIHFDRKAEAERYIRTKPIPSTFVLAGYFMSNFTALGLLHKGEDGVYSLAYPVGENANFPLLDVEADLGKFVVTAMKNRQALLGKQILAAVDYYTPRQIVSEFEKVTGRKARFVTVDETTYKSFLPGPMAHEMYENHLFIENPGYFAGRSLKESTDLVAGVGLELTTWKQFLERNKAFFD